MVLLAISKSFEVAYCQLVAAMCMDLLKDLEIITNDIVCLSISRIEQFRYFCTLICFIYAYLCFLDCSNVILLCYGVLAILEL